MVPAGLDLRARLVWHQQVHYLRPHRAQGRHRRRPRRGRSQSAGWTDPEPTSFRGSYITEFMNRIQDLWTAASLGNVPNLIGGNFNAFIDLFRSWLYDSNSNNTSYETSSWAETRRARAFYEYDGTSAGSGKGRRTSMWDAAGNSSWSYDEYGRVTTATRVVDGRSYASTHTYDALDRVREMTYPDNETLTYSYQTNLRLDRIQSSIGNLDLVSDVVYKDMGLPVSYTLGSSPTSASQSFEYWKLDDATRSPFAAVKRIKLSKDSIDLVNREMQYDAAGNVTKIVDGVNSETVDYTYDDLDRLLTASVPTGEIFAYDTIGNMTSKAGTTLDYGTTAPKHAVKSYGSTTYTYDANGSMTARGTQTIKYDPEQRPIRIQDGTNYYLSTYDGDGVRRKRQDSNGTVHYLGGYERKLADTYNSEVVTKYYSASLGALSRPVAFRRGGTLHWVGADHLGGTVRVMDSSFTALDGMRYRPYGEDRDTGTALVTDRKFTGQTEDESAGLYWYASRAYDPAIGRFVSPDPIVPVPGNPQALNRYSYVYNNPLRYTDPSGHDPLDEVWENEWRNNHPGQELTDHHRRLRLLSLLIKGSEKDGSWNDSDWAAFHDIHERKVSAIDPSNETGVERFARYTKELASWYSPSETEQFVRAFGNLFADIPLSGPWYEALKKAGTPYRKAKYLNIEPTGLKTEYLGEPGETQTHHYAAFVVSGYYMGAARASFLNWLRELGDRFRDPGDIPLGIVGANHGWALRVTDDPANLVSLMRKTLAK